MIETSVSAGPPSSPFGTSNTKPPMDVARVTSGKGGASGLTTLSTASTNISEPSLLLSRRQQTFVCDQKRVSGI
jgi:hypothetical protein